MLKIKKFKESSFDENLLMYHGSSTIIDYFKPGIIFLTSSEYDAEEFGKGSHIFGNIIKSSYLYTIFAKNTNRTHNSDSIIIDFIMDEFNELFGNFVNLDDWIEQIYAEYLRNQGFKYFTFTHPSFSGSNDINVLVSLYPDVDLEILDMEYIK